MMNTKRFVLHLIVGLLAFLLGVTAAIALGGFNPVARLNRSYERRSFTIPQQSLSVDEVPQRYNGCSHSRPRTAELRFQSDLYDSAAPNVLATPDDGADIPPPPPPPPSAPRPRR